LYGPEKSKDTQLIMLSTDKGHFFAVHAIGFPTVHVKRAPARRRTSIWGTARNSKSLTTGNRLSTGERPQREAGTEKATVLHHLAPEKERETKAKNLEKLEAEIAEM
jgi:hypothetical protein